MVKSKMKKLHSKGLFRALVNCVVVNVHENYTKTFIEEIQKEEGVKFAEFCGNMV